MRFSTLVNENIQELLFFLYDVFVDPFLAVLASPLRSSASDNLRRSGSFGKSGKDLHLAASFDSRSRYVDKLFTPKMWQGTSVVELMTI